MLLLRTTVTVIVLIMTAGAQAEACTVCHSKNPKMVKMHEALGFKDCFRCHRPGGMDADKGGRKQMMTTDERCIPCHVNKAGADNRPAT